VLLDVGLVAQDSPKDFLIIEKTLTYNDPKTGIDLVVVPSDEFRITFMVDYQNPALGTQYTSMYSLKDEFVSEYAPSRTFCFLHEVEELWDAGLIKGGSLDNAVVIIDRDMQNDELDELRKKLKLDDKMELGKNGILNGRELRYPNEPVRHKVLDLIGDLALLGVPLKAHVMAARSGHAANVELVKRIRKEYKKKLIKAKYQKTSVEGLVLDTDGIHNILPHRFPFLLVDKIVDLVPQERVVGVKNVTVSEWFFQGHFPGRPVMPGVLIVEAMAQVGGILTLDAVTDPVGKLVYFAGIDNVRFRKPVRPGDQLCFEVEMIKFRKSLCRMSGKAFVDGDLVCEADFAAAIVDEPLVKQ
jgi:UDP-3-O-[3-hydroxymyristoyl] N-acetylglucosamine deacetylase/3-hydroxyacyl-[acyl-carrier-protein] dehydratase